MIRRTRRATKDHKCDYGQDIIKAGETYIEDTHPPWTMTSDDPESSPFKLGEWYRERYHLKCWGE